MIREDTLIEDKWIYDDRIWYKVRDHDRRYEKIREEKIR